jgi:hypothetical protein
MLSHPSFKFVRKLIKVLVIYLDAAGNESSKGLDQKHPSNGNFFMM